MFSSEEDPPLSTGQGDRRKVRKRNIPPSGRSELMDRPANEPARVEKSVDMKNDSLMDDSELVPLISLKGSPVVDMMDMTGCPLQKCSELLSPRSLETIGFEDQDVLSAPLSPNRVQEGRSQDMPFFGAPIAFAQCHKMPGLDTPMTLPIYNLPKEANIFPDQSVVPTVLASGVSPDSIPWSTAEDIIRDISREGPFDASTTQ